MIEIKDLKKIFGETTAINIAELNVEAGSLIGLVGNNGAGKTTLFRLMLDLLKTDSGYVLSYGTDVSKDEKWKEYTGSFIDSRFLIDFLTPEEFLYFVGETYDMRNEVIQV